jgi:hypothetical protein
LESVLSLDREFVVSEHVNLNLPERHRGQPAGWPAPRPSALSYLPFAETLTFTCFGLDSSRFGM